MTAPDDATNHSKNTLRERGHPYRVLTLALANKRRPVAIALAAVSLFPGRDPDKKPCEREGRQRQSNAACQRPSAPRVSPCAERGAYRATNERRRQIDAVEPSARLWGQCKNGSIAEDKIGLHPEVNGNGGSDQKRQRDDRTLRDKDRPEHREHDEGDRGAGPGRPQPRSAIRPPMARQWPQRPRQARKGRCRSASSDSAAQPAARVSLSKTG